MAKSSNPSIQLLSPPMRLSYPKLWKPEIFKDPNTGMEKGAPVYSAEFLCPTDDIGKFRNWDEEKNEWVYDNLSSFCSRLARKRFGDDFDVQGAIDHQGIKWPVSSGDTRAQKGENFAHYANTVVIKGKALSEINGRINAPTLYYFQDKERKAIGRGTEQGAQLASSMFYGGAWAVADLAAVAGNAGGSKYVTLYMNSVVFIRNDEKFGGGNSQLDRTDFDGITGGMSDFDPTSGMSDEIVI